MVSPIGAIVGVAAVEFVLRLVVEEYRAVRRLQAVERQAELTNESIEKLQRTSKGASDKGIDVLSKGLDILKYTIGTLIFTITNLAFSIGTTLLQSALKFLNTMTDVRNRIRAGGQDVMQMRETIKLLAKTSRETGVGLGPLAASFTRFSIALSQTDANTAEITRSLDALARSAVAFGANSQSTAGALLQLSQGMASGQLRGQELNSVLEGMPRFAMAAARAAGVPFQQVRKAAEEGKITVNVLRKAFREFGAETDEVFKTFEKSIPLALKGMLQEALRVFDDVITAARGGHDALSQNDRGIVGYINAVTSDITTAADDYEQTERVTLKLIDVMERLWRIIDVIGESLWKLAKTFFKIAEWAWDIIDSFFDSGVIEFLIERYVRRAKQKAQRELYTMIADILITITWTIAGFIIGMIAGPIGAIFGAILGFVVGRAFGDFGAKIVGAGSDSISWWEEFSHTLGEASPLDALGQAGTSSLDTWRLVNLQLDKQKGRLKSLKPLWADLKTEMRNFREEWDRGWGSPHPMRLSNVIDLKLPTLPTEVGSTGPSTPLFQTKEGLAFSKFLDKLLQQISVDTRWEEKMHRQSSDFQYTGRLPREHLGEVGSPEYQAMEKYLQERAERSENLFKETAEEHKARIAESDEIFKNAMLDITVAVGWVYNHLKEEGLKFSFELGVALNAIGNVALNFVDFFARAAGAAGIESYDNLSSVIGAGRSGYADATADSKDQGAFGKSIAGIATAAGVGSAAGPIGAAAAAGLEIATQAIGHNVKAFEAHTELIERRSDIEKDLVNT